MTEIVNIKKERCDVRIDRSTIFGNPFVIGKDGTRKDVIEKYKIYFYKRLKDSSFYDRVLQLKDKKLGCWCKPLECHGSVIKDYLDNL